MCRGRTGVGECPDDFGGIRRGGRHVGGLGSGRTGRQPGSGRRVESCATIDIAAWLDAGLFGPDAPRSGTWACTTRVGRPAGAVAYGLALDDDGGGVAHLAYRIGGERGISLLYPVLIRPTHPRFGGIRRWFLCPGSSPGVDCDRRVAKLYRPPEARRFACRACHNLAYRSSQQAHQAERVERNRVSLRLMLERTHGIEDVAQLAALARGYLRACTSER